MTPRKPVWVIDHAAERLAAIFNQPPPPPPHPARRKTDPKRAAA